ncbi:Dyp-type peroxidase [Rhodoferax aquaticus]|uniref:Dyp-type peroxidase n=1 Tax=Rhodoferax aquaticus TaxID=2527691 RepID=UPI001F4379C5|nr:Dyp-type peroxidase [Rhodoferax aquaticus]
MNPPVDTCAQAGLLLPVPAHGRYLFFSLQPDVASQSVQAALRALADLVEIANGETLVLGMGLATVDALGSNVPGLRVMPDFSGHGVSVPTTSLDLWCWLRGDARGPLLGQTRAVEQALHAAFRLDRVLEAFRHGDPVAEHGRDLTGYEDGTENPQGADAADAALVAQGAVGLRGSSFVAVQQWQHDMDQFERLGPLAQDHAVGRRLSDNEELDDAPASAHVKRTAQENFTPKAFVLRRSMPWSAGLHSGLYFVAFGHSFDAFEAQMRRMAGHDDGIVDGLFAFTRPLNGAYLWVPPMQGGRLDLRLLGISA